MARVASTSTAAGPLGFRSLSIQSHIRQPCSVNFFSPFQKEDLRHHRIFCQNNSDSVVEVQPVAVPESGSDAATSETTPSSGAGLPEYPTKDLNRRVALASIVSAVGLFVSRRLDFGGGTSLKDLSAAALPYEEALANGKPTVVEFYADWCEVCRELAPDVYKVEQQYK